MRSSENTTSAEVKSEPSWKRTPLRSLNSQVRSSTTRHDSARPGLIFPPASFITSVSKICAPTLLLGVRLWKCGSIEVTSPPRAMLRSAAAQGSERARSSRAAGVFMQGRISYPRAAGRFDRAGGATYPRSLPALSRPPMHLVPSHTRPSVEMLRKLVGFPTVSRDSNLALIHFLRDTLEPLGADIRLTYDEAKHKANLFATLGPRGEPGIMLSGHTDVVPTEGQDWTTDPFHVVERDGRLHGRGTSDMKGFIACVLAALPDFLERGLKSPLHLAFSYDEEVGCIGVGRLISDLQRAGVRPRSCIVGEPTEMMPVIAHKGKKGYRCTVRGLAGHSAYAPHGVNAVEYAAEAIAFLKGLERR